MFRLAVSRLAPVRAAVAARSVARVAALRPVAAVQLQRLAPCAVHQPARSFARQAQEEQQQEEEERAPLPLSEARANLSESLSRVSVLDPELQAWLDEYKQTAGWEVKVNASSQGVLLVRSVEGHEVRVSFRADDILDKEEEEEAEAPREGEEEDVRLVEHAFNIDIVSPNGRVLRLECSNASDGELVLEGFAFPAAVSADPTTAPRAAEEDSLPDQDVIDFNDFPEEVGDHVIDYLESLGVDDDLATFVAHQAEAVRQQKVQQQLASMEKFLQ